MNRKFNYSEQIEHYLDGKMSGEESKAFEKLLDNDPALKSEFQLQQDIINAIKESRKAELKARLDNINISAYNGGMTGAKIAITGALTAVVGLGIYFYTQNKETESEKIDLTEAQIIIPEAEESLFVQPEVKNKTMPAGKKEEENKATEVIARNTVKEKETTAVTTKSKDDATVATINKVKAPLPIETFEEDEAVKSTAPKAPTNKFETLNTTEITSVEIENKEDNNHNFHYKFFNNKLYLYGDFKNIPYELIELNTVSGKSLYLYYKGSYYYLEPNQMEVSPLNQIKDENLTGELENLRRHE